MKLILAQGNPGSKYDKTRHNVGFMALDAFASQKNATFSSKSKFNADVAEIIIDGEKIILAKPTTFYNETGQSARSIVDFYKIDTESVLVLHDELMLPFGTVRTRFRGSDAGNNGIKSLNNHLGENFARIRIGIGAISRMSDVDFVLGVFTPEEQKNLPQIIEAVCVEINSFIADDMSATSHTII